MSNLPENPSLDHLRRQARTLLRQFRAADADALALLREHHPHPHNPLRLADAQLVVARSYGFPSWPALRRHMDAVGRFARSPHTTPPRADIADELVRLGCVGRGDSRADQARAAALLAEHLELSGASIHTAAATGDEAAARTFLARDPAAANRIGGPFDWPPLLYLAYSRIGGDTLPVARLLLDHGADPDAGYLWEGTYPFTALTGAFGGGEDRGNQPPHPQGLALARMLLEAGADPNDSQALYNRQFEPDDAHLRLLIEFGLGSDRDGPWHRRLRSYHGTAAQLLEDVLSYAARYDRPSWARLALAAGADPDGLGTQHPQFGRRTPLDTAVHQGSRAVAELLRAAGASPVAFDAVAEFLSLCLAGIATRSRNVERRTGTSLRGRGRGVPTRCWRPPSSGAERWCACSWSWGSTCTRGIGSRRCTRRPTTGTSSWPPCCWTWARIPLGATARSTPHPWAGPSTTIRRRPPRCCGPTAPEPRCCGPTGLAAALRTPKAHLAPHRRGARWTVGVRGGLRPVETADSPLRRVSLPPWSGPGG